MIRFAFVALLFLAGTTCTVAVSTGAVAQPLDKTFVDTTLVETTLVTTGRWTLHTDSRSAFMEDRIVNTWGLSVGRMWGSKQREVTLGYYWLAPGGGKELNSLLREQAARAGRLTYGQTRLQYLLAGYWHNFINTQQWKVGVPIEAGIGQARLVDRPLLVASPAEESRSRYLILPLQLSGYVEWRATRWIGFGVQTGYRWEIMNPPQVTDLDGMFYRIRLLVYMPTYFDLRDFIFKGRRLRSPFWPIR